jgi:hypothetical protein
MTVARSADSPELLAEALALHGTMKMYEGEVGSARNTYAEAERVLSEHGLAPQRVVSFLRVAELAVFFLSGNVHASKQHAARWLRQAEQSHDVFGQLALPVVGSPAWLVDDRPDLARRWLTDAFARSAGFEHPFASSVWWQAWVDLYTDEPERALARCDAAFRTWRFWVERLVEFNRALFLFMRGQALAACAARAPSDAALRKRLRKTTRALKRHRSSTPKGSPYLQPPAECGRLSCAHPPTSTSENARSPHSASAGFEIRNAGSRCSRPCDEVDDRRGASSHAKSRSRHEIRDDA